MKFEATVSTGLRVTLELPGSSFSAVLDALDRGVWFEDEHGWHINPKQIVFVRALEDEN